MYKNPQIITFTLIKFPSMLDFVLNLITISHDCQFLSTKISCMWCRLARPLKITPCFEGNLLKNARFSNENPNASKIESDDTMDYSNPDYIL